ncbi:hypothetical protein HDU93_000093 [Gonapodya sp. JEL0774]|nr:hypothetical protein HDU93_000093 [Gonapodya sp. JEL0774]
MFASWRFQLSRLQAETAADLAAEQNTAHWIKERAWAKWKGRACVRAQERQVEEVADGHAKRTLQAKCWSGWKEYVSVRSYKEETYGGWELSFVVDPRIIWRLTVGAIAFAIHHDIQSLLHRLVRDWRHLTFRALAVRDAARFAEWFDRKHCFREMWQKWKRRLQIKRDSIKKEKRADEFLDGTWKRRTFSMWRAKMDRFWMAGRAHDLKVASVLFSRWLWRLRALVAEKERVEMGPGVEIWRKRELCKAVNLWRDYVKSRKAKEVRRLLRNLSQTYLTARLLRQSLAVWVRARAWKIRERILEARAESTWEDTVKRRGISGLIWNVAVRKADREIEGVALAQNERRIVRKAWQSFLWHVERRREKEEDRSMASMWRYVKTLGRAWQIWEHKVNVMKVERKKLEVAEEFWTVREARKVIAAWKGFARSRSLARLSFTSLSLSRTLCLRKFCFGVWRRAALERVLVKRTVEMEVKRREVERMVAAFVSWMSWARSKKEARKGEDDRVETLRNELRNSKSNQ